ncbi:MAG: SDR family oxidoreductase, partial [Planctomycetaceae bacterium]|nr:SDR family oxidoreductase [Planctomycetaceae bacterium]
MDTQFEGQVALITGGTSGIGRATAEALRARGAEVHVCDFKARAEAELALQAQGISISQCDVRDVTALKLWIDSVAQSSGRIDILVNNAGIGLVKQCPDVTESEWDAVIDTNLKAAFFACGAAIPHMRQSGGGSIINIASNAGLLPRAHDPVYSISKLALVGLTKSLALSQSPDRIRVNAICPGPVKGTEIIEAELALHPDYAAAVKRFIAASPMAQAYG